MDTRFIEGFLLRCFILGFALLMFWLVFFLVAGGFMYDVHGSMFEMTRHQFNMIHYCGMGLLKIFVFVVFLLPYIAIRLTAKKQKSSD